MKSDVMLQKDGKTLIIDTKFLSQSMQHNALYNSTRYHSSNLYQIYTYVKNKDDQRSGKVSGMLLYAKTTQAISPDESFTLDGNLFHVKTLDLNLPFMGIAKQLENIVRKWQV